MKKLITILVMLVAINASGQWVSQQSNTTSTLNSLFFINSTTGWVAGDIGTILKTTNGGVNWIAKSGGTNVHFRSISFYDSNTGWFCGDQGTAKKSTDGGDTWNYQSLPTPNMLTDIFIIDQNNVYIIGGNVFFRTTNGGNNWTIITGYGGNYLYFTSLSTGFIVGGNQIQKTVNQGTNWTLVYSGSSGLGKIMFPNTNTGYAGAGNGTFVKTTNGGNNWAPFSSPILYDLIDVYFNDALTGYMIGSSSSIIKTTNGGINWSVQNSGILGSLSEIQFTNNNNGWIVGSNGAILHTTNGGVGIKQISGFVPDTYSLAQNYPNPFNSSSNFKFQISKLGNVKISVYDVKGREVQTLVNESLQPGTYETTFDGSMQNSGVYFYKLMTEGFTETKKMLLIK